jgi:hypothetical protein
MIVQRFKANPMRLVAIGMLCVSAGAVSTHYHVPGMSSNAADFLSGCLYGVGLATMILGMVLKRRGARGA